MTADVAGANVIRYHDAAIPPLISGTVSPAPTLSVVPTLASCPLCGNSVIDQGESCDDTNTVSGDGCSADCLDEGCFAQTPGYPAVPLCDDGFPCTVDACVDDTCEHTTDDLICDDNNPYTDQACAVAQGCVFTANFAACDDELHCNGSDDCAGGGCRLHTGDPCVGLPACFDYCDESDDACLAPFGIACSSDADICTDDVCNGLGACTHLINSAPCDDGIFCNGPDFCSSGSCSLHIGDPCFGGAECADFCVEVAAACQSPAGSVCGDDGDVCTDDRCDGAGSCVHSPNSVACDDGDLCTVSDQCSAGVCIATDISTLSSAGLKVSLKVRAANDRFTLKAELPASELTSLPSDTGIVFEMRDAAATPFYVATMPAQYVTDSGGNGPSFRFRDGKGAVPEAGGISSAKVKRNTSKGVGFKVV